MMNEKFSLLTRVSVSGNKNKAQILIAHKARFLPAKSSIGWAWIEVAPFVWTVFLFFKWSLCFFQAACLTVGSITAYASSGVLFFNFECGLDRLYQSRYCMIDLRASLTES